jgi:hypothetical protein
VANGQGFFFFFWATKKNGWRIQQRDFGEFFSKTFAISRGKKEKQLEVSRQI